MAKSKSSDFCRVCADLADNTKPLFEGSMQKLLAKIKDLTGLKLNKIKDLPQNICKTCEQQIQQAHTFRERCIRAQQTFESPLSCTNEETVEEDSPKNIRKKRKIRDRSPKFKQEEQETSPIEEVLCSETSVFKVEAPDAGEEEKNIADVEVELLLPPKHEPKNATDDDDDDKISNDSFHFLLAETDEHATGTMDTAADACENPLSNKNVSAKPKPSSRRRKKPPPATPNSDPKPKSGEKSERVEHNFICDQCGKNFNNKQHLLTHLQRHTGISTYPCKLCPKGYYAPGDLRRHMYKHTGEKPYHCKFCECSFNDNSHLLQHTRREHTKERPFVCDQCPKTFYNSCNYKAHLTTHSGVRAFSCKLCNVSYKHRSHLKRHQNSVMHKQYLEKQNSALPIHMA